MTSLNPHFLEKKFFFVPAKPILLCLLITLIPALAVTLPEKYQVLVPSKLRPFNFVEDSANANPGETTKINFASFLNKGDIVILHLWSTACPSCIKEMPDLDRFAARNISKPLKVIAISVDDPKAVSLYHYFLKNNLMHLKPYHRQSYGYPKIRGLPTTFFIDPNGDLVGKIEGRQDWEDPALVRLIDRLASTPEKRVELNVWQKILNWIGL